MAVGLTCWLFAVSLGASALGGMLGMAKGIFIVPILIMLGGVEIHTAIAASIVSVIACSCGSAAPFLREKLTNVRLAIMRRDSIWQADTHLAIFHNASYTQPVGVSGTLRLPPASFSVGPETRPAQFSERGQCGRLF